MATAEIATKSKASFAITIETIRIGSKRTAVSTRAIDGGMPTNLDFGFCFGVWGFKGSRLADGSSLEPSLTVGCRAFRVIWWIAFCRQKLDPRNHTKRHEGNLSSLPAGHCQ